LLDSPDSEDEIYLARAGDIDPYRPICQGDVFADVQIPGIADPVTVVVMSHPCAMRAGPRLRPRVMVALVSERASIPLGEWATGHLRLMPLPGLNPERPEQSYAANLEEPTTIESSSLMIERRVASLTDNGIALLQQRHIHNHCRAEIPLALLYDVSAAVLEELELQETWNLQLVKPAVEAGGDLDCLLEQEAECFDALLSSAPAEGLSLRDMLKTPAKRAEVRRTVNQHIDARAA
jgi:hypothetical protein